MVAARSGPAALSRCAERPAFAARARVSTGKRCPRLGGARLSPALLRGVADLHPRYAGEERVGEVGEGLVKLGHEPLDYVLAERELLQSLANDERGEDCSDKLHDEIANRKGYVPGFDKEAKCQGCDKGAENVGGDNQENSKCHVPAGLLSKLQRLITSFL